MVGWCEYIVEMFVFVVVVFCEGIFEIVSVGMIWEIGLDCIVSEGWMLV